MKKLLILSGLLILCGCAPQIEEKETPKKCFSSPCLHSTKGITYIVCTGEGQNSCDNWYNDVCYRTDSYTMKEGCVVLENKERTICGTFEIISCPYEHCDEYATSKEVPCYVHLP